MGLWENSAAVISVDDGYGWKEMRYKMNRFRRIYHNFAEKFTQEIFRKGYVHCKTINSEQRLESEMKKNGVEIIR